VYLATAALCVALVLIAGGSPIRAGEALLESALFSPAALGETMARLTGILFCALAGVLAFRGGVLNIGIEGQFLVGAVAAAAVAPVATMGIAATPLALSAAAAAGALACVPAAWLAEKRGVPPVLSTILLNLVFAAAVTWAVRGPLRDPAGDYPQSRPVSEEQAFSPLVSGSRITLAPFLALAAALGLAVFLRRTGPGLRMRAVGDSPLAARGAGLNDVRIRTSVFLASGALAGLGGGLEVVAVTWRLYDPFATGTGFNGIAAALLGGTSPVGAVFSSFFLAALGAGSRAIERDAGIPAAIATIVPALAVLAVLTHQAYRKRDRG
jgi:simple sugar transport system permease protein